MKAEIKLGPKEVEQIVRDYIARETNHTVNSVRFDIEQGYQDRPGLSIGPSLREVIVSVDLGDRKSPPPPPPPPPPRRL